MANERTLEIAITGTVAVQYRKTTPDISSDNPADDFTYTKQRITFKNGAEVQQCDILYHEKRSFSPPGPEVLDLNNALVNKWNDSLDFYTIKVIIIKNLSVLGSDKYLKVTIQAEVYYIGPQGTRQIIEPDVLGLLTDAASSGGDPGNITFDGDNALDFDIIIGGTTDITNISSGT